LFWRYPSPGTFPTQYPYGSSRPLHPVCVGTTFWSSAAHYRTPRPAANHPDKSTSVVGTSNARPLLTDFLTAPYERVAGLPEKNTGAQLPTLPTSWPIISPIPPSKLLKVGSWPFFYFVGSPANRPSHAAHPKGYA
jgi:hypothetical protein